MNQKTRRILALFFLAAASFPLSAQANHVRIRTLAGMEPIGMLSVTGFAGGGRSSWSTGYGFTPGLEVYYILNSRIEVGAGFKWQLNRRVFRDGGSVDETFSFIPIYITTRIGLTEINRFSTYALIKLGYAVFQNSQAFRDIWISEAGGELSSTSGGIYAGVSLGVLLNLKERTKWGLDLSMDVGYAFQSASGTNASRTYPISYQAMSVDMALEWRF
ncbi:MAG: hypothetical protein KAH21_02280 [Spirochaetaceae bacterium]|nr:hypothetical protein [Spirochaetaceae bacterium]